MTQTVDCPCSDTAVRAQTHCHQTYGIIATASCWLPCILVSLHHALQGDKNNLILASGIVRTERELHKLFTTLAERYAGREGGYTRVVQIGRRQHDSAPMAFIE